MKNARTCDSTAFAASSLASLTEPSSQIVIGCRSLTQRHGVAGIERVNLADRGHARYTFRVRLSNTAGRGFEAEWDRCRWIARIAQEFDGWAPERTALITDSDTAPVLRPLNALPIGHRWDRVPAVTLLGDVAHLSAPNGEGANLAMYDGAELGTAIAAHPDDVEAALVQYERALFLRIADAAAEAARDFELCFGDDALRSLIGLLSGHEQTR